MKKIIVTILMAAISIMTYGQTNELNDTLPSLHKKYEKEFNDLLLKNSSGSVLDKYKLELKPDPLEKFNYPENLKANSQYTTFPKLRLYDGPPLSGSYVSQKPYDYIQSHTGNFSFVYDYNYSGSYKLADNLYITSTSALESRPSIGSIRSVNPQLTYIPADWIQISGGGFATKYNFAGDAFNDIGYNGALKIIPHDRIRFNVYGQYSVYSKSNMIDLHNNSINSRGPVNMNGAMMHMYPQTYYGGSIEFKITEKFGVEAGVIRELNPFNGKWENRRFIAPVIYGK